MPFTVRTNYTDRQHFSTIRTWVSRSVRTLRTETIISQSVTVRVYWTTLPENAGNGISETLNFKLFWGSMTPDPPRGERLRRSKYSLRAYTFKITRYAPAKLILIHSVFHLQRTTQIKNQESALANFVQL